MFNWLKNLFSSLLRIFKAFVKEAFSEAEKILVAEFKEIAVSIVSDLDITTLTNEEKRAIAFKKIKKVLIKAGKDVGDSLINRLLELAVGYIKNN